MPSHAFLDFTGKASQTLFLHETSADDLFHFLVKTFKERNLVAVGTVKSNPIH